MSSLKKASVIIRTHNEIRLVKKLMIALKKQNYPNYEIIVVDSESNDGTVETVKELGAKVVHIKDEDFTFGYSLNVGCEAADGEILLFISGHCIPENENWIKELVKPYQDENVGMVYGMQRGDDTTKFSESRIFKKYFLKDDNSIHERSMFCNNANNSLRKDLWDEIYFDESFSGLEDLDMSIRINNIGYVTEYSPSAKIIHIHDENWKQVENRFKREAIAMKQMFPERNMNRYEMINLILRRTAEDIYFNLKNGKMQFKEIFLYRLHQYRGMYEGLKKVENSFIPPTRVYKEWNKREIIPIKIRQNKFKQISYISTLIAIIIFGILISLNFGILPLIISTSLIWLASWITLVPSPKETIDLEDLKRENLKD